MFDPISIIKSTAEKKAREEGASPEEIYLAGELAVDSAFKRVMGRIKPLPKNTIIFSNPDREKLLRHRPALPM